MPTWKVTRCTGPDCGRPIVFLKKPNAPGVMPIDYHETGPNCVSELDTHFVPGRHMPHHATCPNADDFRKKKRPKR